MCRRHTVSSLIEVLPRACDNLPLEASLQECSYFQQVLFAESLPGAFFQSKVRKMRFLSLTLGFILKLPLVFIHGYMHRCLRLLCKRPCAGNLLIIKFSLGALLLGPRVGSAGWAMSADRQRPVPCFSSLVTALYCAFLSPLGFVIMGPDWTNARQVSWSINVMSTEKE